MIYPDEMPKINVDSYKNRCKKDSTDDIQFYVLQSSNLQSAFC
jgi:hypothetical protein